MSAYLQFAVLGLAAGAVYTALANGLVATYRATGILNFALGATAAYGAYTYATLRASGELVLPIGRLGVGEMATVPALGVAMAIAIALGLLSHLLVFRPLRNAPTLAQVVASVGLMLVMQALVALRFGSATITPDHVLPSGTWDIFGAELSQTSLLLAAIAILMSLGTWAYFRFTRLGIATSAGAVDERALRLMGYAPDRLAAIVFAGSAVTATFVITLEAPTVGLNPTLFAVAIVPALAVALLGRLSSFAVCAAAGLGLGAFQSLVQYLTVKPWWPSWAITGVQDAVPFLVIIVALFAFGGRIPSRGSLGELALPKVTIPRLKPAQVIGVVALTAALLVVTSGNYRFGLTTSIIMSLLALSYVVITGYLGQISLAQLAIAGTAGIALSKLTTDVGLGFPISMLASALIATALGVVVGLPAMRIRGAQLAVVTLAMAVAVESFILNNQELTPLNGNLIADPSFLGVNLAIREGTNTTRLIFCFMVLAIVLATTLLVAKLLRGNTGRAFLAVRSNERAAASVGIDVVKVKLIGFTVAAFVAGIAGTLIDYSRGQLSGASFTAVGGLAVFAIAYLGGIVSVAGAIVAGLLAPLGVAYVFNADTLQLGQYYSLFAGLSLVVTAIFNPVGVAGGLRNMVDIVRARASRRGEPPDGQAEEMSEPPDTDTEVLHAR